MTVTATFSKGETFKYGGKRNVKAAWCIRVVSTGEVIRKGFSLDLDRAKNTLEGAAPAYVATQPVTFEVVEID